MGKASPSQPDPVATANAQAAANRGTAITQTHLNNPDVFGPGGSVTHDWTPGGDTSRVTTTLSAGQQDIYDKQQALTQGTSQAALDASGRMQDYLKTGLDTSGLTGWNSGPAGSPALRTSIGGAGEGLEKMGTQDYGQQRADVEAAIMSRVQPQYERDRTAQDAKLAAMGFTPGSEGYRSAADEINRTLTDARMQAVLAGGQEQSRLAGLDQSRLGFNNNVQETGFNQRAQDAGFYNTAAGQQFNMDSAAAQNQNQTRQAQLAERLQLRSQPINETAALFGLGNGVQMPQMQQFQGSQVAAPDYQGLVANNAKAASAAAAQNNAATTSAITSAAMAAAMIASDRRIKEGVKEVGELHNGLPIYSYRYKGDGKTQIGVMAQDVEKRDPGAVGSLFGIKMVDLDRATQR